MLHICGYWFCSARDEFEFCADMHFLSIFQYSLQPHKKFEACFISKFIILIILGSVMDLLLSEKAEQSTGF